MNILFLNDDGISKLDDKRNISDTINLYGTFYADSTKKALEIIRQFKIDVIVADIKNPYEDTKFLVKMKQKYPGIGRIVLSGNSVSGSESLSWPIIHQYLEKPYNSSSLIAKIDKVINSIGKISNTTKFD